MKRKTIILGLFLFLGLVAVGAWLLAFPTILPRLWSNKLIFSAGRLSEYSTPDVYDHFRFDQKVNIVHLPEGHLVAMSAACPHLGCILDWLPEYQKFRDPCHGCGFRMNGINFEGPVPIPLPRYKIAFENGEILVDKSVEFHQERGEWGSSGSFIDVGTSATA